MQIPQPLLAALDAVRQAGGRPRLVGGCVRDGLLGIPAKDFDVEVGRMDFERLHRALTPFGPTDVIGRSFGVIKVRIEGVEYDFSLPRRESKTGSGHRGFYVKPEPDLRPLPCLPDRPAQRRKGPACRPPAPHQRGLRGGPPARPARHAVRCALQPAPRSRHRRPV